MGTIERDLVRLMRQALDDDGKQSLIAVRLLRGEHLTWLERRAVALARTDGLSWAQIGRLLGVSRQAVRQRFGSLPDVATASAPGMPRHFDLDEQRRYDEVLHSHTRDQRHRALYDSDDVTAW